MVSFAAAAEIDVAKLPPPAAAKVDFNRDIRPIFEQSCLRCHGPERPKSHFRLTSREGALKGGDNNTNDIVPGDSGRSHLIHYVAGLVEDMQMPPPGKAEPLTPAQISLLRAWIDQGAAWGTAAQFPQSTFAFTPSLRWTGVEGNKAKFRELERVKEGWGGGAERFSLEEQDTPDTKLSVEGHVLLPEDDLRLNLNWTKSDVGFVHAGFDRWRKYYDDHGGFFPPNNAFRLDRDLHLDIGRAWIDFGLTLPDRPQIVLGYEYQFKQGDEATLQWGPVAVPNAPVPKSIFPAAKHIDENTHVIKLDASYDVLGWRLEDSARVELYSLGTGRTNRWPDAFLFPSSLRDSVASVRESDRHTQGANTFSVNKQFRDWLAVFGGYYYSRLDGNATVNQSTLDNLGNPTLGQQWSADNISLKRESQSVSVGSLLGPWNGLILSLGVQGDWTRQESMGLEQLLYGTPANPDPFLVSSTNNAIGNYDRAGARENVILRCTTIPFTVLFAEARLRQESLRQFEEGYIEAFTVFGPFTNHTDADTRSEEYRVGFNSSPWQRLSFGASLKHTENHTDYASSNTQPGNYPGFIQWRDIGQNQIEARVVYRAASWLKTSFNYRWQKSDFDSATTRLAPPGGPIEAGDQEAHVYSLNAVLTPLRRLYLSSTFSYSDSRIATTFDGTDGLVPWQGHVYSALSSVTFALNPETDLSATYLFSKSDYAQQNQSTGLPAGINYERHGLQVGVTHRFANKIAAGVRYAYSQYREPTSGNVNDFKAHGVFATLAVPWP